MSGATGGSGMAGVNRVAVWVGSRPYGGNWAMTAGLA
jgi:hypothetical protein